MRLIIRDLKKIFDKKTIIDGASYSFEHGCVYGVVGGKESGKTTFLKCLCGELTPNEGTVRLEADWIEHKIKFQDFGIIADVPVVPEYMTGYEYYDSIMELHEDIAEEGKSADYYFDLAGLSKKIRNNLIKEYSVAERRRLQLVSTLILRPSVIIFDSPVVNDKKSSIMEFKKIIENLKTDRIVIISTDNVNLAIEVCDETLLLKNGCITAVKPEDISKEEINA